MRRIRVTNSFLNYLHRANISYNDVVKYFGNVNNFNIRVIDYDRAYKQLGRIVATGTINGNSTNVYMYSNKSYRCSD